MKSFKITSIIFSLAVILAGGTSAMAQTGLSGVRWSLTEANGKAVSNSRANIVISADGTKLSGNTGCNNMFGAVAIEGKQITISQIGSTRMMCKLAEGNVPEIEFTEALRNAKNFVRKGKRLSLKNAEGIVTLRFRASEMPRIDPGRGDGKMPEEGAMKLSGHKWILESVGGSSLPAMRNAYLVFDETAMRVGGNTGCNSTGGNYKTEGIMLHFTGMIQTMMACMEDERMTIERQFSDALKNTDRYAFKDGKLNLYKGNELLATFLAAAKDQK